MDDYKKETISAYNRDAAYYAKKFTEHSEKYMAPFLERFVNELKGPKVLDIGCGPGIHLEFFREMGLDALGIDLSDSFLEICAGKGLNVRKMDMEEPLLYPYSFDGIWANAAILHVPRERVPPMLVKWAKLLKPNGILHMAVKQGAGDELRPNKQTPDRKRYFSYFSEDEVKALFAPRFELLDGKTYAGEDGAIWIDYLFRVKPETKMKPRNF